MNFPWKPHQLMGHWVPGFVVLAICVLADAHAHQGAAVWSKITNSLSSNFALVSAIVVPFVIRQFLDDEKP
jgi:hypothetical protein